MIFPRYSEESLNRGISKKNRGISKFLFFLRKRLEPKCLKTPFLLTVYRRSYPELQVNYDTIIEKTR